MLWSRGGPDRRELGWYNCRSCLVGLPEEEDFCSKKVQMSPEYITAAERVARDDPKQRLNPASQENCRRGLLSGGNHQRTLKHIY